VVPKPVAPEALSGQYRVCGVFVLKRCKAASILSACVEQDPRGAQCVVVGSRRLGETPMETTISGDGASSMRKGDKMCDTEQIRRSAAGMRLLR
jgi:hypothetical protein